MNMLNGRDRGAEKMIEDAEKMIEDAEKMIEDAEKMIEDAETKDRVTVPSLSIRDPKSTFVTAIQSKHGLQTTSTPNFGAFYASGCGNMKHSYDSGCNPSLSWDTPIYKVPHRLKSCGHQSSDTFSNTDPRLNEPHPQLNLLPCFEERSVTDEFPNMQTELGNLDIWSDHHPKQKRRSLEIDKSPSPNRNKRLSLDLNNDSGCFSIRTTRSDSQFSREVTHPSFHSPVTERTGESNFLELVYSAKQELIHSPPSDPVRSFSGFCFSSGGPQSVWNYDPHCIVNLEDMISESGHIVQPDPAPSFEEKLFNMQPVSLSSCGCSSSLVDVGGQPTYSICSDSTLLSGKNVPNVPLVLTCDSGCSVNSADISGPSTHSIHSNSTPLYGEKVVKLQPFLPRDSGSSFSLIDFTGSSTQVCSESTQQFGRIAFDTQSVLTSDLSCKVNPVDISRLSDLFVAKATSCLQDFSADTRENSLKMTGSDNSEVLCNIPQTLKLSRKQTFEERLAVSKTKLDQEIGVRIGKKYVDVLKELSRKSFVEPLAKVFEYLSEEELCSICLVSRHWKTAVDLDATARLRRRRYVEENRQRIAETPQENRTKLKKPTRQENFTIPSKPMVQIQTKEELPPAKPVVPALTKGEEFLRESRSLDRSESLRKCPICDSPARVNEKDRRARCTKDECRYEFCVFCRKMFHEGSECITYVRNPSAATIGSKQSKRNLRRL